MFVISDEVRKLFFVFLELRFLGYVPKLAIGELKTAKIQNLLLKLELPSFFGIKPQKRTM